MPSNILSSAHQSRTDPQARRPDYGIVCHVIRSITRFVYNLAKSVAIHLQIFAIAIGCLAHYVARLSAIGGRLGELRREIRVRGLDKR